MHWSVDVPDVVLIDRLMLVLLRLQTNPVEGPIIVESVIVPENPLIPDTVTSDDLLVPIGRKRKVGWALTANSLGGGPRTRTVRAAMWQRFPLHAVRLTL